MDLLEFHGTINPNAPRVPPAPRKTLAELIEERRPEVIDLTEEAVDAQAVAR